MKNISSKFTYIFLLTFITVNACSDFLYESQEAEEQELQMMTRSAGFEASDYYLFRGQRIPIQRVDGKFYALFYAEDKYKIGLARTNAVIESLDIVIDYSFLTDERSPASRTDRPKVAAIIQGNYEQITPILTAALYVAPYFLSEKGGKMGLTEYFSVDLKSETTLSQLEELANRNFVEIIGRDKYVSNRYHLVCNRLSNGNALEMANLFFKTGLFEDAFPDFVVDIIYDCINEPSFHDGSLWHLGNNFTVSPVHVNYCNLRTIMPQGSPNITVAIIDDGVQSTHRDLFNVLPGWDAVTSTAPNYGDRPGNSSRHGTQVAGFIAAIPNNGIDVAGIAHGVRVLPVSLGSIGRNADIERAIRYAATRARVINCSWHLLTSFNSSVVGAIEYALSRDCIIVFSSGNNQPNNNIPFPANSDPRLLVVGAVNQIGMRASFSGFGTTLDIVAPGEEVMTTFPVQSLPTIVNNGTSFAAPQVAATAALILSANPNLTARRVVDIIESTASKWGPYSYLTTPERPNGTWNSQMGYGLLNAYEAVKAAISIPVISGPDLVCGNTTYTVSNVPSGATVSWRHSPNLQQVNGLASAIATFQALGSSGGAGWIEVSVNGIPSERRNVTVSGLPHLGGIAILTNPGFSQNLCRDVNYTMTAQAYHGINDGVTRYIWDFGGWAQFITGYSPSSTGIANAQVHFRLGQQATVQAIQVLPINPCSPEPELGYFPFPPGTPAGIFYATNCFGGWALPLTVEHPNPVSSILPIQINPHPQLVANRVSRNAIGLEYDIRLYDSRGNAVRQMTTDRERIELDINGLPNGNYFLHIYDGMIDAPIVQRIIIEN